MNIFKSIATLLLVFFVPNTGYSQSGNPQNMPATMEIGISDPLHIIFSTDKPVDNLLVIVSDSTGQTIFLDNKYRFKGFYNRSVLLTQSGKGHYYLTIMMDADRVKRDIIVK